MRALCLSGVTSTLAGVRTETEPHAGSGGVRLRLAVVDGPDGTATRRAPEERTQALEMQARHANTLWCSTVAGGCGGEMELTAGPVIRPYFRHRANASPCSLAGDPARAERSYEHVRYQRALLDWLAGQGLTGHAEHSMGDDGRADLHVMVDEVSHSIEVQRSPLNGPTWAERDRKCRRSMDHVTWLYGGHAEAAAAREQTVRGVALHLDRDDVGGGVRVGVQGRSGTTWSPLEECHLGADGLWTPHLAAAQHEHTQWLDEQDRAAQAQRERAQRAEKAERERAERAERERAARDRRRARAEGHWRTEEQLLPIPAPAYTWPGTAERWRAAHPEAQEWVTTQDWRWLNDVDDARRPLVQFMAYLTQRIYFNGPTAMFDLPDVPDAERILDLLQEAGLVQRSQRAGVPRWQRCMAV